MRRRGRCSTPISGLRRAIWGEALKPQGAFHNLISWSGLDIGRDRSSRCPHYTTAFDFTGKLLKVTLVMYEDQNLDGAGVGNAQMARQ